MIGGNWYWGVLVNVAGLMQCSTRSANTLYCIQTIIAALSWGGNGRYVYPPFDCDKPLDLYHQSLRTDQRCVCQDRCSHTCTEGRYTEPGQVTLPNPPAPIGLARRSVTCPPVNPSPAPNSAKMPSDSRYNERWEYQMRTLGWMSKGLEYGAINQQGHDERHCKK